ncbi:unnamed protein product [Eruca vesicaria subsp. sativa]|uniref:Uncharacterized protein n=1 Tax=Eruca vesicaria subsp. sativa TaxID=29727 RepID=A0ABC8LR74_ERUVS|nr:unnamed protein product [Eruca vesicaria subsp. sativa]
MKLANCYNHSLLHEKDDCPLLRNGAQKVEPYKLGINQRNALMRIEADKRKHDERRGYVRPSDLRPSEPRRHISDDGHRRGSARFASRRSENPSSGYRAARYSEDSRDRYSGRRSNYSSDSLRHRSDLVYRAREVSSGRRPVLVDQLQTSAGNSGNSKERRPALERISEPQSPFLPDQNTQNSAGNSGNSKERRSALTRISEPRPLALARIGGTSSLESGRLQDVEIQYLGNENEELLPRRISRTSTEVPDIIVNSGPERIATREDSTGDLATDIIHLSLRLGARSATAEGSERKLATKGTATKTAAKRRTTKAQAAKRITKPTSQESVLG